jgi:hypothetical protein
VNIALLAEVPPHQTNRDSLTETTGHVAPAWWPTMQKPRTATKSRVHVRIRAAIGRSRLRAESSPNAADHLMKKVGHRAVAHVPLLLVKRGLFTLAQDFLFARG